MKRLLAILMTMAMLLGASAGLAEAAFSEPGVMPIVTEPVTLRFLVTETPAIIDWSTNEFILWMEEQTGVHIEFDTVPADGRREKLNLILATGDYPDVFLGFGGDFTNAAILQYGSKEGMLLPLNDYIDQYAPNTLKVFEQYPGSRGKITQLDGNIYILPNVNECYHCTMAAKMWINQVWLDNLGLEMPTTLDEFYDVLVAFRDNDPNQNGKQDEIPFAGSYLSGWYDTGDRFILNCFTYYDLALETSITGASVPALGLYVEDDKIVVPFDKAELKDGLKFMRKLVEEGLYYDGSFTQNDTQLTQLAENADANLLGAAGGGYNLFTQLGGERYREYRALLPLVGPDGYQNTVVWPHDSVGGNSFVVSASCKYPEIAVMWGDYLLSLETSLRSYYGVEGVDWEWAQEGDIGISGEPALYRQLTPWQDTEPQNQNLVQNCISFRDAAFRFGMVAEGDVDIYSGDGLEVLLYQVTKEYEPYGRPEMSIPPIKFTTEEADALAVIRTEVATAIKEGMINFMTGARDVDTEYDAWVKELEAKGLRTIIEAFQKAYDEQYK